MIGLKGEFSIIFSPQYEGDTILQPIISHDLRLTDTIVVPWTVYTHRKQIHKNYLRMNYLDEDEDSNWPILACIGF